MPLLPNVPCLFEYQVNQYPNRFALNFNEKRLTYSELNAKANQLAHYLIEKGGLTSFIPLFLEKSIESMVSLLAILKTGLAYIPISTDATDSMIEAILLDSQATKVITQSKFGSRFAKQGIEVINLDDIEQEVGQFPKTNLVKKPLSSDSAYVIYTSGTTGLPKGVEVTHDNLVWTYYSWEKAYDLTASDVHLQMAHPCFDVFAGDYLRALGSGAELVLCSKEILLHPQALIELIKKTKVSCAEFIPAVLRNLMSYMKLHQIPFNQFRLLVCGSDLWTMREFRAAKNLFGSSVRLVNSYGLTEATIDSTFFEDSKGSFADTDLVPIGKPFSHVNVYLLDEQLNQLSTNEIGEIYIGGKGVAKGYLGREDLTKERFITRPQTKERLYRTGDFGKLLEDGTIEFLGRNQSHTKIYGNRVELPALEAVLNQQPKIEFGIAYASMQNHHHELGCFILASDESLTYEEVMSPIKEHLPNYYLPKRIYLIKELVLTQNGKVDRAFASQQIIGELKPVILAPRNALEEQILLVWKKQLSIKEIGVDQNYYELGGSSLVLATLMSELNQVFKVNLNFCSAALTIQGLAKQINRLCDLSFKDEVGYVME
ncbi:non-ribosomal peptide synthetase [Legionella drozanskii]|uniref:Peptide synthetase, non-ribosomal n=1 Tax=Legionella drozanskii LLAP-1 TaxID=1212489 RepID=A0A0W0SWC9_9GAMM|nr:non-ribosomal peptide synthetase [Legionella drozanskii]KTC87682.1 peptide synthetase, non-ribosomal [Legionella drozanskii LLAP-1]